VPHPRDLLENGVALDEALQVEIEAAKNVRLREAYQQMSQTVRRGNPLAVPAEQAGLFPEMIVRMIRVGEQTAELGPMLQEAADHYEAAVQDTAATLASSAFPESVSSNSDSTCEAVQGRCCP
jgi:type II secretory pathway component PulF